MQKHLKDVLPLVHNLHNMVLATKKHPQNCLNFQPFLASWPFQICFGSNRQTTAGVPESPLRLRKKTRPGNGRTPSFHSTWTWWFLETVLIRTIIIDTGSRFHWHIQCSWVHLIINAPSPVKHVPSSWTKVPQEKDGLFSVKRCQLHKAAFIGFLHIVIPRGIIQVGGDRFGPWKPNCLVDRFDNVNHKSPYHRHGCSHGFEVLK